MGDFILLKRTYPISQHERYCDGYEYIIKRLSRERDKTIDIHKLDIQKIINIGEKYIYQVGKENGKFKVISLSFKNHKLIRELFHNNKD